MHNTEMKDAAIIATGWPSVCDIAADSPGRRVQRLEFVAMPADALRFVVPAPAAGGHRFLVEFAVLALGNQ